MANFGTAYIDVAGNFAPLEAEINGLASGPIGRKFTTVGKSLTKNLTLPIVGVGLAAAKLSMDFQRSMTLISTQAGGTKKEVKALGDAILSGSAKGRFTQSANELAQGLFHIESTGARGKKAWKDLKATADLATVGNANYEATTNAVVGVQKTQIKGTKNLRMEIGLLNAGIGVGNLKMEDLNGAIGTGFVGSSKALGLSLQDDLAALGELTSQSVPANAAATRLRMTFSLLANPTEKAAGVLEGIGISSEDLAKKMRQPDGLVKALELLKEHLKGLTPIEQNQLLSKAFGGAKSGGTLLQLLENVGDLNKKYVELGKNAGDFNEKLHETNEDPGVKLDRAWRGIEASLNQIGSQILPVVVPMFQEIAGFVTSIGEDFNDLSPSSKHLVVEIGLIVAALGPGLTIAGKMVGTFSTLASVIRKAAEAAGVLTVAEQGAAGAGVGGVGSVKGRLNAGELLLPAAGAEGMAATISKPATLAIPAAPGVAEGSGGILAGALAAAPESAPWIALGAAIAAAGVGVVLLYQDSKKFREIVAPMGQALDGSLREIGGRLEAIGRSFSGLSKALSGHEGLVGAFRGLYGAVKGPVDAVGALLGGKLVTSITNVSGNIGQMIRGIGHSFAGFGQVVQGAVEVITGILTLKFAKFFKGLKDIFSGSFKTLVGVVEAATTPFADAARSTGLALQTVFGGIWGKIEGVFEGGVNAVIGLLNDMIGLIDKLPFVNIGKIGELQAPSTSKGGLGKTRSGTSFHKKAEGGIVPGHGEGDSFSTMVPPNTFILNKKATPTFGFKSGGRVPVMLEPGERVFYPPEVKALGLGNLEAMNAAVPRFSVGGFVESAANSLASLPGEALGAARGLAGAGIGAILDSLPNPAGLLPNWLAGFGNYLKTQLVDWVKGKQKQQQKKHGSQGAPSGAAFKHGRFTFPLPAGSWGQPISVDQGVDIAAPGGTPLLAIARGTIMGHGISGFGPSAPILGLGGGTEVYYGHAGPGHLTPTGTHVRAGQQIGEVGSGIVGISTGPHLELGFYPPGPMGAGAAMKSALGLQRGGPVQKLAKGGSADGVNIAHPKWEPEFLKWMGGAWNRSAHLYGQSAGAAPPPLFLTKGLHSHNGDVGYEQAGTVELEAALAGRAMGGNGFSEEALLHEWAHVFQKSGMKRWEVEGGATDFARWAGPQIFAGVGDVPYPMGYKKYAERVASQRGQGWIAKGQFGHQLGGLVQKLAAGGSVKGPWAGTSIDKTYPTSDGSSGEKLPDYVIAALAEWAGMPGVTMDQITMGESMGHPGVDVPDPPGRSRGLYAINDHYNPKYGATAMRNPILNTLAAGDLASAAGGPNAGIWHGSSHVTGWNLHYKGDPTAIANHLGGAGGGSGSSAIAKQVTGSYGAKKGTTGKGGGTNAPPGKYKVTTGSLSLGSLPTKIHECRRELTELRAKLPEYRAAIRDTKDPKTKHALQANLQAIQHRIAALIKQIQRIVAKERRENLVTKIEGRGAMPAVEEAIATAERRYNESYEMAEQIVGLEPEEGGAAKTYIEGQEGPAWSNVLDREATWRNAILGGEDAAQLRLRMLEAQMESIDALKTTKPKAYKKQKFKLPGIKKAIEGVKSLYTPILAVATGKGANRVSALQNLAAGNYTGDTGSLAEALVNVQGAGHSRSRIDSLPSMPVAGAFGGLIWDTQMQIKELGLKIKQATESSTPDDSARVALLEELLRQANQEKIVRGIEQKTLAEFPPYAGKAHSGAIVPGPATSERTMVVKGGEGIFTREQGDWLGEAISSVPQTSSQTPEVHVHQHFAKGAGMDPTKIKTEIEDELGRREVRGARTAGRRFIPAGRLG